MIKISDEELALNELLGHNDWSWITRNVELSYDFIDRYKERLNWSYLSVHVAYDIKYLWQFKDYIRWELYFAMNPTFTCDIELIDYLLDNNKITHIDINGLAMRNGLSFNIYYRYWNVIDNEYRQFIRPLYKQRIINIIYSIINALRRNK